MIQSVLTVCTANICRSPLAEFALKRIVPDLTVESAGVQALVGKDMDREARETAATMGLEIPAHRARQLDDSLGIAADLILVMQRHHRDDIGRYWPHLLGKTFLMGQFLDGIDIPDPYRRGKAMHFRAADLILQCSDLWGKQIEGMRR